MEKPFATTKDILSEAAFLALTNLTERKFRDLVRAGKIPGARVLGRGSYVVVMGDFAYPETEERTHYEVYADAR